MFIFILLLFIFFYFFNLIQFYTLFWKKSVTKKLLLTKAVAKSAFNKSSGKTYF
jgi:hypothetical protein